MESKIPLISGRPFFPTADALINRRNGLMKLSFGNMTLEVNIVSIGKQPRDMEECYQTYMIDTFVSNKVYLYNEFESSNYLIHNLDFDPLLFPINAINISSVLMKSSRISN